MLTDWPCPLADGQTSNEYALAYETGAKSKVLILPALFDESNKTRRQSVEIMRRLASSGIDCALPDLPGQNESTLPLEDQSLAAWQVASAAAAQHFQSTHVLTIRGGAILAPPHLPGWQYVPTSGSKIVKALLRARTISSREAGKDETRDELDAFARSEGIELAGYCISAELYRDLADHKRENDTGLQEIAQTDLNAGGGLWLRAEPDYVAAQADALAAIITMALRELGGTP